MVETGMIKPDEMLLGAVLFMSIELLDRTRRINRLLHDNRVGKVAFNDICCVLGELLDSNARVKIGVTDRPNGVMKLYTKDGELCVEHFVKSSVVKPCRDDYFCKWTLKFA